ncbi:MAG: hypothetical protein HFJ52_09160 [Clostridia bacterium]|nr:hypothetical protein [Clostridia bacterium]
MYPKENLGLFRKILQTGGLVITEYPPEEKPLPSNFPKRNRIISGLSQGIIIPEAGEKSGSLITVDIALDQGKEIFAIPRKYHFKNVKRNKQSNKARSKTNRKYI